MAKPRQAQTAVVAVSVPFTTLRGILGKSVDDAAVTAVLASAGKVKIGSDSVVAKDAGFDIALEQARGAKRTAKKILTTLYLYKDGADGHRGYCELPEITTEAWSVDGLDYRVSYSGGELHHVKVSLAEGALDAVALDTRPLHFATRPADAHADADLTAMALLVSWAADRFGLPAKHASTPLADKLIAHAITPRSFLVDACARTLSTLDFVPQLAEFLGIYTGSMPSEVSAARAVADAKIMALLGLDAPGQSYGADYLATFSGVLDNPHYVPDTWEAVARITPVIDARLADFEATRFRTAPNVRFYTKAAKARDMWSVDAARAG